MLHLRNASEPSSDVVCSVVLAYAPVASMGGTISFCFRKAL